MKTFLFALAALLFLAGVAPAAEPLSDVQMDRVTAGDLLADTLRTVCPACTISILNGTPTPTISVNLTNNSGTNAKLDAILAGVVGQLIAQGYLQSP
jgi:hypothetical protein